MLNANGAQCTAKSKSTGERCKNPCVTGSTKCRLHGGKSPRGASHPNFKTGQHSKYLPARLSAIYEEIEDDLEANVLSRNLRLREAFIRQQLAKLEDAPDAAQVWESLRKELDNLTAYFQNEDYGRVAVTLDRIGRMVDERQLYHQNIAEIRKDLNEQRNDTTAKAAITLKGESAVSAAELMAFVGAIMNLISTTVSNANERNRIYDAIERLTGAKESAPKELVSTAASLETD